MKFGNEGTKNSSKSPFNCHRGERHFLKNETPLAAFFRKKAEELKCFFRQCFLTGKFYIIVTISLAPTSTDDTVTTPQKKLIGAYRK